MTGVALLESGNGRRAGGFRGNRRPIGLCCRRRRGTACGLSHGGQLFGEDAAALRRMAGVAAGPLRLSAYLPRQRGPTILRKSIVPARLCLPPWVTTCVRRWRASRSPSPACGSRIRRSRWRRRPHLLATIEDSTDALSELVDNLLGLSRLQAGVLSVHLDAILLDAVVGAALMHLGPRSTQINLEVPDDLPGPCRCRSFGAGRGEPACQRPDSKPARPSGRGVSRGHCRSGELDHCRLRTRGAGGAP